MNVQFRLSATTEDAGVYFENMPPMPVPRVGEDVLVGGDAVGWWRVTEVRWFLPAMGAMEPTMEAVLMVEWSPVNTRPAPIYNEDRGWVSERTINPGSGT